MGSERSAPWGGARPTSPTPPFSPLSKVTARRLLRYTQEWRPSGTALLTAVAFATLLLLNVEASFSLSALSKGWKRDDVNGGKADAFTLTQVQALLKVTNSSVNIENLTAEERRTLFSIEQVAALVRLDNRGGIPQKIGRKLSGQGRKGIADVLFRSADVSTSTEDGTRGAVDELMAQWRKGYGLDDPHMDEGVALPETVPRAPHLDDCKDLDTMNRWLDTRREDGSVPLWSQWSGEVDFRSDRRADPANGEWIDHSEELIGLRPTVQGPFPPWVRGADEDNALLTRRVQRDIWLHQHPADCSAPGLKFLFLPFFPTEKYPYGTGAQIQAAEGVLGLAMAEGRVLVFQDYERADHDGCKGESRNQWSCYFAPETTLECRARAAALYADPGARANKTVTDYSDYKKDFHFMTDTLPTIWGKPWLSQAPSVEVAGQMVTSTGEDHRRWWRHQATRYLMRYQSQYLCRLTNQERHRLFGEEHAKNVVAATTIRDAPHVQKAPRGPVLSTLTPQHRPMFARPTIAIHVRQGDKKSAGEMDLFPLEKYMELAESIRFERPELDTIFLTTEMEDIANQARAYKHWRVLFTDVPRQKGDEPMWHYEQSIGRERSSANAFVNLMMSAEADYFVLTMGSTWSLLIDDLKSTNGRFRAGVLSVNRDRRWDWNEGVTRV